MLDKLVELGIGLQRGLKAVEYPTMMSVAINGSDEVSAYWITRSDIVLNTTIPVSFPWSFSGSPGVGSIQVRFEIMDFRDDSMVAETVAQCSYNTAYKALCRIRSTNAKLENMGDT